MRSSRGLWALAGLGLAARLLLASLSVGSNDAEIWHFFGYVVREHGLVSTYRGMPAFNHPPLMGLMAGLASSLASASGLRFSLLFKLPVIATELACAFLIWRIYRHEGTRRAALAVALFSVNPLSIVLSGYHGNTDCMGAMFCLASTYALNAKRYTWAGVALAAAINVKLIPLMLVPALTFSVPNRRALLRFGAGLALGVLPFLPIALKAWPEFRRNVLEYNSMVNKWGVQLFFTGKTVDSTAQSAVLSTFYLRIGRWLILGSTVLAGIVQRVTRRLSSFELAACALCLFLIFTPGFGIQYAVWPVPLLFAANLRWGAAYSLLGGLFAAIVYYTFWTGTSPWYSNFDGFFRFPAPQIGAAAWAVLIAFVLTRLKTALRSEPRHPLLN